MQYLTLERTPTGYAGAAIFLASIRPLRELNSLPVSPTVRLNFEPPYSDRVALVLCLGSGKVTVQRGKETLTDDVERATASLDADQVLFAVLDTLGIELDWTVSSLELIKAREPICADIPIECRHQMTPSATVGSLTSKNSAGPISLAKTGIVAGPKSGAPLAPAEMPAGSKITSLRREADSWGGLAAVATMDADVAEPAESSAEQGQALIIAVNLAGPEFFGIDYPYVVTWLWQPANPTPTHAGVDAPPYSRITIGDVLFAVEGREIRFDLGGYVPANHEITDLGPASVLLVPFGDFATSFLAPSSLANSRCLCPGDLAPAEVAPAAPAEENLRYEIVGNLLTITRESTGAVAYGWVDRDGRFPAESDQELYLGVIEIVPHEGGYDVGVTGIHLRMLPEQPDRTADASGIDPSRLALVASTANLAACDEACWALHLRGLWIVLTEFDSSTSSICLLFGDCDVLEIAALVLQPPTAHQAEQALMDQIENIGDQTNGMGMLSGPFGGGTNSQLSASQAVATGPELPFPFTRDTETLRYEPLPADPDWAIRAGSFFQVTDGSFVSLTGPYVDSRLFVTASDPSAGTTVRAMAVAPAPLALLECRPIRRRRTTRLPSNREAGQGCLRSSFRSSSFV